MNSSEMQNVRAEVQRVKLKKISENTLRSENNVSMLLN